MQFKISDRQISNEDFPLVIAEIGINHGGSLEVAKKMVDKAVESGAEVIKHQTHIIHDEMSRAAKKVIPGNSNDSIYKIMSDCSLSEKDEMKLQEHVSKQGAIFISTPFSRKAADRLERMNVPAFKIGSGECNNYPLIDHIASFKKPIILSTGMNNINSVKKAVEIIRKYNVPLALLHTTNIYPTEPEQVRLGAMVQLKESFPDCLVGLSDHTTSNHACFGAVALGACILERHFTDSMDRVGPDIVCSMDPKALKDLIFGSNRIFLSRGGNKEPHEDEKKTIDFAFATVVSIKDIKKGQLLTKENIWVKRPGTGEIKAESYNLILGKKALIDIPNDMHLKKVHIENFS